MTADRILERMSLLEKESAEVREYYGLADPERSKRMASWVQWSTSVQDVLERVFGANSPYTGNFRAVCKNMSGHSPQILAAKAVFEASKRDLESGYIIDLQTRISGELFGDFVVLAKRSLSEGYKDVAAVLACAALEDTLKRFASQQGLDVEGRSMQDIVAALKSKGLVTGAQKSLLDSMPKIRDYAMHAEWSKVTEPDVNSVIGYVEQFLLTHFSS